MASASAAALVAMARSLVRASAGQLGLGGLDVGLGLLEVGGGAATQIGGEELRNHNPRNRAHREGEARGEAHHEDEHAQLVVVRIGEGDTEGEQHHEAGADRHELLTAGGINQVHAHHGEHELDAAPSPYGPLNETLWQIVVKPLSFIQIAPSHLHD